MQAPIKLAAQSPQRLTSIPPMSGSIAALANWNSRMQPAKMSKRRSLRMVRRPIIKSRGTRSALAHKIARANASERHQRGRDEGSGQEKYRLIGNEVSARAHQGGRRCVADRGEAGIATEPFAKRGMADETETDRDDCRPEHAACSGVHDPRRHHDCEAWPKRKPKGTCADPRDRNSRDEFCRAHGIDECAARHLRHERDQGAHRQDEADV